MTVNFKNKSLIFLFILIFFPILTLRVSASCSQQGTCLENNGWYGCYPIHAGGSDSCSINGCNTDVTSDINSVGYCSNIGTLSNVLATFEGNDCSEHRWITYRFCKPGIGPRAPVSGKLILYADYPVQINGKNFPAGSNIDTGIDVNEGDKISVKMIDHEFVSSPGWMQPSPTSGSKFQTQIDDNNQILISSELWADNIQYFYRETNSGTKSYVYNYDSYDFEDMEIAIAIETNPYGPYLKTNSGNSFIKGKLDMSKFPNKIIPSQYFSTYNYSTQVNSEINASIPTNIVSNWLTAKKYLLINYNDNNGRSDYFEYLRSVIGVGAKIYVNNSSTTLPDNIFDNFLKNNDVITINGDLTINSGFVCNYRNIFFINNNLIINSNITNKGLDSACLFIVKNDTFVSGSVRRIDSFLITKKFSTDLSNVRFDLLGGLITQSNNFLRNIYLNITPNRDIPPEPSEILNYEGARYIKLFGNLLYEPTKISIREIQYTN